MNSNNSAFMACLLCLGLETSVATAATPVAAEAAPAHDSDSTKWLGEWTGVEHESSGNFRGEALFDLEIRATPSGLELIDKDRQLGNAAPAPLAIKGNEFTTELHGLWPAPIRVTGRLSPDGQTIDLLRSDAGMTGTESHRVTLRHDDPSARKYLAPRVTAVGTRELACHSTAPKPTADRIPVATLQAVNIDPTPLAGLMQSICAESGKSDERQTESVLILRHGKLVFEEYFWGQTAANPHVISSSTKSVTSIITGIAVERGKLKPDATIASYFPDRLNSLWVHQKYPITVRNVLSMSSGTAWDDSVKGAENPSAKLLESHDVVGYMFDKPSIHPAGAVYNYDNGLPSLMGDLVARVTGEPFERFAAENLFKPMHITNYRWTTMRDGSVLAAGGFYMLPRDMAKIGEMMLNRGRWEGRQIVSSAWVAESTRQQSAPDQYPYGFYWHLTNAQHRHVRGADGYMALGQGGQVIAVFPILDLVVVTTSQNWHSSGLTAMPFDLFDKYILPAVTP